MLTIGRTLMGNPDLLLLDEPSEGLAPLVVRDLGTQIQRLKDEGITILLCEQNAKFATALSDRAYVLEKGQVRFYGHDQGAAGQRRSAASISGALKSAPLDVSLLPWTLHCRPCREIRAV